MTRPRVVVAGLGDTGVLTAVRLARHAGVVGVSVKPGFVSGQELGHRLTDPDRWAQDYRFGFDRMRGLDRVSVVHGEASAADTLRRRIRLELGWQACVPAFGATVSVPAAPRTDAA